MLKEDTVDRLTAVSWDGGSIAGKKKEKNNNTAWWTALWDNKKEAERVLLRSEGVEVAKDLLSLCFMMLNVDSDWTLFVILFHFCGILFCIWVQFMPHVLPQRC